MCTIGHEQSLIKAFPFSSSVGNTRLMPQRIKTGARAAVYVRPTIPARPPAQQVPKGCRQEPP